tara:strand:- start:3845 stop:4228 length:384 start_codon:yes stop_codon:yes gene_type:complete
MRISKKQKKQLRTLGLGALGIGAATMMYNKYKDARRRTEAAKKIQEAYRSQRAAAAKGVDYYTYGDSDSDWDSDSENDFYSEPAKSKWTGTYRATYGPIRQEMSRSRWNPFASQRRRRRSISRRRKS